MEAFESFVALAMETEGLVVSEAVKFPVTRQTKKTSHAEIQTHWYEVDLVGARRDRLVMATVKSYLGSQGVRSDEVQGIRVGRTDGNRRYAMLNDPEIRDGILAGAAARYDYEPSQIEYRLYVGKFAAAKQGTHETVIRDWCAGQHVGAGPISVHDLAEVAMAARRLAGTKTYRDNPALVAIKVLEEAKMLVPLPPG
ncbi:hypothetical protein [Nocardioides sp.]|uniref:hypothetical protein n=1 Tax=Nocardioides sp. TaxID=35761 RepID=UPI003D127A06